MYTSLFGSPRAEAAPKEGELYKIIEALGERFEIYYGYYEDSDRESPYSRPVELYPDFKTKPIYTADGIPFATAIQKPCEHFSGDTDEDNTCYQCAHYEKCEELLGVCRCKERRQRKNE